jgi:hypothetical protein
MAAEESRCAGLVFMPQARETATARDDAITAEAPECETDLIAEERTEERGGRHHPEVELASAGQRGREQYRRLGGYE